MAESGKRFCCAEESRMRMEGLRDRTKAFAVRVLRVTSALPKGVEPGVIGKQLIRSGTSVAANFREASRARSDAEFIAKLGIVEQEIDESQLWLEIVGERGHLPLEQLDPLIAECDELLAIVITAIKKTRNK